MKRIIGLALAAAIFGIQPAQAQKKKASPTDSQVRVEVMLDNIATKLVVAADAHWHKGEYNHNVNVTRMVVSARPDMVDMYANAGWLLWSMNKDEEAESLYKEGLQHNPNTYFMYDELGQFYFLRKRDYANAAKYYEKAVKFRDAKPQTWNVLARSYEKSGQMAKALKAWEKAASFPGNLAAKPNLQRVRAIIKQQDGTQ